MIKKILCVSLLLLSAMSLSAKGEDDQDDGVITLTLWDDKSTESEARVIQKLVDQWNSENPDVQIVRESADIESYKMKLRTAMIADQAPDIFYSMGGGFSKAFVDSGNVLSLNNYLSDHIKEVALPGSFDSATYGSEVYGLPITKWAGILYCNTELLSAHGLSVPTTFADLVKISEVFKDKGGALGVGASEKWTAAMYHNVMALRAAGAEGCRAALEGQASLDSAEMQLAAEKLNYLIEADAFNDGFLARNYDETVALFTQGQFPVIYQGNWLAGTIEADDSPVKGKVVAVDFPSLEGGKGDAKEFLGGAVDLYMVNANTKNKEAAVRVLEFICENYSRMGFEEGLGLPVYETALEFTSVDPLTKQIMDITKEATGYLLAWDTFLDGEAAQEHVTLVQNLFAGVLTPAEFSFETGKLTD